MNPGRDGGDETSHPPSRNPVRRRLHPLASRTTARPFPPPPRTDLKRLFHLDASGHKERREQMANRLTPGGVAVERLEVSAYTIPTDAPEADGTFSWDKTTLVLVEASAGGARGLGYTYADTATARLIADSLAPVVQGRDALAVPAAWVAMVRAIRNLGRPGVVS